jgi:hypothetical protein
MSLQRPGRRGVASISSRFIPSGAQGSTQVGVARKLPTARSKVVNNRLERRLWFQEKGQRKHASGNQRTEEAYQRAGTSIPIKVLSLFTTPRDDHGPIIVSDPHEVLIQTLHFLRREILHWTPSDIPVFVRSFLPCD